MKQLFRIPVVMTVTVFLSFPSPASARPVHYFDCQYCHRSGASISSLTNNLCLDCHDVSAGSMTLNDQATVSAGGRFSSGDASDLFGANLLGVKQNSHNWAAREANPGARAQAPSNAYFSGRMGYSRGWVVCSRCHNPHDQQETNPTLMKLPPVVNNPEDGEPYGPEDLCLDCHRSWNQQGNRGLETHPLVDDYAAAVAARPGWLQAVPTAGGAGSSVQLIDGGVTCFSCHGAHYVDSDGSTPDGRGQGAVSGDGRLLRSSGPGRGDDSALCTACHTYSQHGDSSGEQVGCLVCHGGHAPDAGGEPNYYLLRKQITTGSFGTVGGVAYSDPGVLVAANRFTYWNDQVSGQANGFCEKCHGDAEGIGAGAGSYHVVNAVCTDCHQHAGAGQGSFLASCDGCHAYPPAWNSHQAHTTDDRMVAPLDCAACHDGSGHINDLSEVRFASSDSRLSGASYSDQGGDESSRFTVAGGYGATPAYGECATLYCHSNGAPFDKANQFKQPTWGGAGMSCASCHDGAGSGTGLSGRHGRHTELTTYAIGCAKCHAATVSDSSTVSDNSEHVDRQKDVVFANAIGGSYDGGSRGCNDTACHSDGAGGAPNRAVSWADTDPTLCSDCHNGRIGDASEMSSNAHDRLASSSWIRQYRCQYCHAGTVDAAGTISGYGNHVNQSKDVVFDSKWSITGLPAPGYNGATMVCDNLYCHSDGTTVSPEVRDFPWDLGEHAKCDSCHGHPGGECSDCHVDDGITGWSVEEEWKAAMPMYANTGPGTPRANSHLRHLETEFTCENCHATTVVGSCGTASCHDGGVPAGDMTEVGHVDAAYHVNKIKDVVFKDGGSYDQATKTCSNTACHTGADPQWGDSRNGQILCLTCHGTTETEVDDYGAFNGVQAKINMNQWFSSGHGRAAADGPYTSGNPAADFPGNPCWYCHDNEVLHKDPTNPYRLKHHDQFDKRFEKECVYCHMERKDEECRTCHNGAESLSHQLADITGIDPDDGAPYTVDHAPFAGDTTSCLTSGCHLPQDEAACSSCHANPGDTSGAKQLTTGAVQVGMQASPYALDHAEFAPTGSYAAVSCLASAVDWPPTGCHTADAHIHNTGAGTWSAELKEDVKNQYMMMGVCLQCHDNDDNDRCNSCHTWSGAPEENPYRLGYDPGTGFKSGSSKASSTHFGYKHFAAFQAGLELVAGSGTLSGQAVADPSGQTTTLQDSAQSWAADELVGKAVALTGGPSQGEIRTILLNTGDSVTVSGQFTTLPAAGTAFEVRSSEWRGGKFCWDCHDPHGDSNIYMIQDQVATRTEGLFGKPLERSAVSFTRTLSGLDYAKSSAPFNGICNVCHSDVDHYHRDFGDAHRSGRRCTDCHEHGFGEGHGSGKSCDECHQQKPVPNHLGFGQPRDCTKCHDGAIMKRMDIMRQFRGQSHHVQGIEVDNKKCYACHWEATPEGLIDLSYHAGYNYKTHGATANARSDLVIYGLSTRPTSYELGVTATTFTAEKIGTGEERTEVGKVTNHCLGCHSDQNNDSEPFDDCKTPRQYAWDGNSIAARYEQTGTTQLGKYSGFTGTAKKIQTKAYSAHGNAVANQGGWDAATGEDGTLPNTRNGTQNVQCFDCHSSHGSYTTGVTSSYKTFNGENQGANLKETQAGKGGYNVTYKAAAITNGSSSLNPGAAQCFDCHETQDAGAKPWGYSSTFGASAAIQGYWDSSYFDGQDNGIKGRRTYRADGGKTGVSGHFSHLSPDVSGTPAEGIDGLCAGCHDPHGVSPVLGDDQAYGVPLLKGTWLTSPYKEDSPQMLLTTNISSSNVQIDRKTFDDKTNRTHITEGAEQFAGLCLRCHAKDDLTDDYDPEVGAKPAWTSMRRIHQTVKGWGSNQEHQFPCSKCHQPHSSGLGRLMRTNCLDWNHRGEVVSGGPAPSWRSETEHYPRLRTQYQPCHQSSGAAGGTETSGNFRNQSWNTVTPW